MKLRSYLAMFAATVGIFTTNSTSAAEVVSINLAADSGQFNNDATDSAGVIYAPYWFQTNQSTDTPANTISDNSGALTPIALTWDTGMTATGTSSGKTGFSTVDANDKGDLMQGTHGWVAGAYSTQNAFTLSGLNSFTSSSTCDIYIYFAGWWNDKISFRDVTASGSGQSFDCYRGNSGNGPYREQFDAEQLYGAGNNYVVFRNIATDTFTLQAQSYTGNWVNVNGIQIVKNDALTQTRPSNLCTTMNSGTEQLIEWDALIDPTSYELKLYSDKEFSTQVGSTLTPASTARSITATVSPDTRYYFEISAITGADVLVSRSSFMTDHATGLGKIVEYDFNGDYTSSRVLLDSSGQGNDSDAVPSEIVLEDGVASYPSGIDGKRITINDIGVTTNNVTLSAWVKVDTEATIDSYTAIIGTRTNHALNLGIKQDSDPDKVGLIYEWAGCGYGDVGLTFRKGRWTLVTLVVSKSKGLTYYVQQADGLYSNQKNLVKSPSEVTLTSMNIGIDPNNSSRTYTGLIDNVRMWDEPLDQAEVEAIFESEKAVFNVDPVVYLKFNDNVDTTATDERGLADGTLTGATWTSDSYEGTAVAYVDAGDKVETASVQFVSEAGEFSVSAWVKPSAVAGSQPIISQKDIFTLRLNDNKIGLTTPGKKDYTNAGYTVSAGEWIRVVLTFTPNQTGGAKYYINGSLDSSVDSTGLTVASQPIQLGVNQWGGQQFKGIIDEVKVFSRVLSADEVNALSPPLAPASPAGVTLVKQEDETLKATWSLGVGAPPTGFKWELATDESFSSVIDSGTIVNPVATEVITTAKLSANGFYHFRVCSYVGDTNENWVVTKIVNYSAESFVTFDGAGVLSVTGLAGLFSDEITISFWAKAADDLVQNWLFSGSSDTNTDLRISAHVPWVDGKVYYDAGGDATANRVSNAINVDQHTWNHYAMVTSSDGTAIVYINGEVLASAEPAAYASGFNMDTFVIGGEAFVNPSVTNPYKGDVDSFRVWSVARSQSEIQALMFSEPPATRATTGLALNFTFDDSLDDGFATNSATDDDSLNAAVDGVVLTPAIGMSVVQEGNVLSWIVAVESGVKEYRIVNAETGVEITTETADPEQNGSYSVVLPEGVDAKLIVIDITGLTKAFLPADGNVVNAVYSLMKGWNMIAMPGNNPDISELEEVTSGGMWGWNGSSYELIENPVTGDALWVYVPETVEIVIRAEKVQAGLELATGWNMAGPTETIAVPEEAHTVYAWNDKYQIVANDGYLMEGVGYWIFVTK